MRIPFGYLYKRRAGRRFSAGSKQSGTFYFSNPGPDGKEKPVSLRTADRDTAERRAVEMCGRINLTDEALWLKSLVDLGRWASVRIGEVEKESVPFDKVWSSYEASRRRPPSGERTLKHYGVIWGQFAKWVKAGGSLKNLEQLIPAACERYVVHLEQSLKESSVRKHLAVLKLIFRVVCPDVTNPWDGLRIQKHSQPVKKRALSAEEVKRLVSACRRFRKPDLSEEFAGLHLVGYWTGLRLYDAVHLHGRHVDRENWIIRLVPRKTGRKKPEPLEIPVSVELRRWLSSVPDGGPVFPGLAECYDRTAGSRIVNFLAEIWKDAKVLDDDRGTASFHSLRVTFQSMMDAAGTSRVFTRAVTGHSSAKMSDTYSRTDVERVREAVGKAIPEVC